MQVSAYIPCYNGAATLAEAIEGLKRQERAVDELFVVDNGSTDESARVAEAAGVRVIRIEHCMGRGASRARAMEEARHPLVACCDASVVLPPDFVGNAMAWFEDAECGRGVRADFPARSPDRGGPVARAALIPHG